MFGRMKIRPWDPSILWNDNFPKEERTFGSLQRSQWDPYILLSYLNCVESFVGEGSQGFFPTLKSCIRYCKGPQSFDFSLEVLIF